MLHYSKSAQMKKQTHLHLEWPKGEYNFSKCIFLVNYCLKKTRHFNTVTSGVPVAQWLEHCVSSAKVEGSIAREHTY